MLSPTGAFSAEQRITARDYDAWLAQNTLLARWTRFWFSPKRILFLNTPARGLPAALALRPADKVLDIGCGYAGLLIYLHRRVGFLPLMEGLDCSPFMVRQATAELLHRGMESCICVQQGLATELPYERGSLDVVLCTYVIKHLSDEALRSMLREVRRVLKPGGRFFVSEAAPSQLGFMQAWNLKLLRLGVSVVHLRTAETLRGFLEGAGFTGLHPYGNGAYFYYPPLPRTGFIAISPDT